MTASENTAVPGSPAGKDPVAPGRRDAMLKLLRLGGLGAATAGLGFWLNSRSHKPEGEVALNVNRNLTVAKDPNLPEMAVIQGDDAAALIRRAVEEMGGMKRFVGRNDVVVIKPNIAWDRNPEQAANTNPQEVAEMVRLVREAGAAKVIVTDVSCNDPRRCFQRSGIADAAKAAGAQVILPDETKFREVDLKGDMLRIWPVFEPFLTADKIISMPIAKHHSLTGCTLGFKNWYGLLGGQRNRLHQRIHDSLADLGAFMRPTLTVMDAYRVLMRNGPTGGNLEDVALKKTVIASTDPVALDAYAAKAYWDLDAAKLPYLQMATERRLGTTEFEKLKLATVTL